MDFQKLGMAVLAVVIGMYVYSIVGKYLPSM